MKFMLLCYDDEAYWIAAGTDVHRAAMAEAAELCQEIDARGQYLMASPLQPVATAKSVRIRGGQRVVTDGPFTETREVLGGFYVIDVPDVQTAIDIAARHPGAVVGTVEVRPLVELAGLPEGAARRSAPEPLG